MGAGGAELGCWENGTVKQELLSLSIKKAALKNHKTAQKQSESSALDREWQEAVREPEKVTSKVILSQGNRIQKTEKLQTKQTRWLPKAQQTLQTAHN